MEPKTFLDWFLAHCEGDITIKDCVLHTDEGDVPIPNIEKKGDEIKYSTRMLKGG